MTEQQLSRIFLEEQKLAGNPPPPSASKSTHAIDTASIAVLQPSLTRRVAPLVGDVK